jgi:hypothetical protein
MGGARGCFKPPNLTIPTGRLPSTHSSACPTDSVIEDWGGKEKASDPKRPPSQHVRQANFTPGARCGKVKQCPRSGLVVYGRAVGDWMVERQNSAAAGH